MSDVAPSENHRRQRVREAHKGESLRDFYERELPALGEALAGTPAGIEKRQELVDTFLRLIEGLYVHLPLKRAMYGKDPVQRLRLLRQRAGSVEPRAFHAELATVLTELRDSHTRYLGPGPWRGKVAALPFMVEVFGPTERPRCLVSNVTEGDPVFEGTPFGQGVEVLWWNGMPIARAIERHADRETGGRPDARLARARESLTFRPLGYGLPPDEYWVHVGYRTEDGAEHEIRVDWRVLDTGRKREVEEKELPVRTAFAVDPAAESVRRAKQLLFASRVWYRQEYGQATAVEREQAPEPGEWITGRFQDNVSAKTVETEAGDFGYLRLWSFDLIDADGFLAEVQELLGLLPGRGLIVDLRGNPGGLVWAAERLLQLFTPHGIEPVRFSLLATDLTREMAEAPQNRVSLEPWRRSLKAAVANGEPYSRAVPLTPRSLCNDRGQHYGGPVVAVVDANTYSAGDLFAAGWADNRVGPLVSIGQATGAGGANVWMPAEVQRALAGTPYALPELPEGVGFTLAVRRALRSGDAAGTVIEDVGVPGQFRYQLTAKDLTGGNADLLEYCGALLASEPRSSLAVERLLDCCLGVETSGIDRVDVYVDGRPVSASLTLGLEPVRVDLPQNWAEAEVLGFRGQTLRQRRLVKR